MKLVLAMVSPKRLEALKKALWERKIRGVTLSPGEGYGIQKVQLEAVAGTDYRVSYQPRIRVEIAAADEEVETIVELLTEIVRTGRIGDGKIFVLPIEDVIRVRTGERGEAAL